MIQRVLDKDLVVFPAGRDGAGVPRSRHSSLPQACLWRTLATVPQPWQSHKHAGAVGDVSLGGPPAALSLPAVGMVGARLPKFGSLQIAAKSHVDKRKLGPGLGVPTTGAKQI